MSGLRKSLSNWMFPNPDREGSAVPANVSQQPQSEDQVQTTQASEPPPSESPSPPEPMQKEMSMGEIHQTITEALDRIGIQYGQREDRDDLYFLESEGVLLVVGVKGVDGVPAGVVIVAIVLENVECTAELAVDLLKRNSKATFATWSISDKSDGAVDIHFEYQLSVEQLDVPLVERMVNWVLNSAVAEVEALQTTYGGDRPVVVEEKTPDLVTMPTGPLTFAGRYPGHEPAQAMAAFLSVPSQRDRPSHRELQDSCWGYDGGGYEFVVGCFAEPDGTPVIVVSGFCEQKPEYAEVAATFLLLQRNALEESAHSTQSLGENGLEEAIASGKLRQLRPSEIGPIPDPRGE